MQLFYFTQPIYAVRHSVYPLSILGSANNTITISTSLLYLYCLITAAIIGDNMTNSGCVKYLSKCVLTIMSGRDKACTDTRGIIWTMY